MKNNSQFSHILITRFNLRNDAWNNLTKNKNIVLSEDWLTDRFKLFEEFCLPSVAQQNHKNFQWWVFFDQNTPEIYKEKIIGYKNGCPQFQPFFVDGMPEFLPNIQKKLKTLTEEFVMTSRLDNDDCLHKDYIQYHQDNFKPKHKLAVDLIDGYTLQIQPIVKLGYKKHAYNPFITYIEKNENPKSVWFQNHAEWKRHKKIERVLGQRLWMSIIHDNNKVNEFFGYGESLGSTILKDFGLKNAELLQNKLVNKGLINNLKNQCKNNFELFYLDLKKAIGLYS